MMRASSCSLEFDERGSRTTAFRDIPTSIGALWILSISVEKEKEKEASSSVIWEVDREEGGDKRTKNWGGGLST